MSTTLTDIQALSYRIDKALMSLRSERRDVKSEYDTEVRRLEKAKMALLAAGDQPDMFDIEESLDPELTAILENPSLK